MHLQTVLNHFQQNKFSEEINDGNTASEKVYLFDELEKDFNETLRDKFNKHSDKIRKLYQKTNKGENKYQQTELNHQSPIFYKENQKQAYFIEEKFKNKISKL